MRRLVPTFFLACLLTLWSGCGGSEQSAPAASAEQQDTIYSCSMHPQIRQPEPGNCPICGMKLEPVQAGAAENPRLLELSPAAQALADVQTTVVKRQPAIREVDLFGVINTDDTRVATVTARFPGRIEKLFVNFAGTRVRKGEHLAEIYSDSLVEAQSELIGALRFEDNDASAEGIKERLRLWDIPEDQIELIDSTRKPVYRVRIDSPAGGVVTQLDVREGDYVETGSRLFEVTDLSQLWVHLDAYETDLPWLRYGQHVDLRAKAYPGEVFSGTIAFIQPVLDRETRTVKVRVNVSNTEGKLRPGMFVRGEVDAHLGDGGQVVAPSLAGKYIGPMHPEIVSDTPGNCPICGMPLEPASELGYAAYDPGEPPLMVPASAVLRTGSRAVVYVEEQNGQYVGLEIELGPRAGDYFVVKAGLAEGDRVVTNGAFRLDSELQIQAKPSMMNPPAAPSSQSGDALPMDSSATGPAEAAEPVDFYTLHEKIPLQFTASAPLNQAISHALEAYWPLKDALDRNAFEEAKQAAAQLEQRLEDLPMKEVPPEAMALFMDERARGLSAAQSLAKDPQTDRANRVEAVSEALISLVQIFKWSGDTPVYLMYCPMAKGDIGARWLQTAPEVENPYYGPDMFSCGEVLAVWNEKTSRWEDNN